MGLYKKPVAAFLFSLLAGIFIALSSVIMCFGGVGGSLLVGVV
ncbi:MAG: hypothetical protein QW186_08920 [Candidatus Bathyarchaeia archaeon]